METFPSHQREALPESRNIMILGILVFATGILGFAFIPSLISMLIGIIQSILLIRSGKKLKADPRKYTPQSIGVRRAGKIFMMIGLSFALIFFALWAYAYFTDAIYFGNPNE